MPGNKSQNHKSNIPEYHKDRPNVMAPYYKAITHTVQYITKAGVIKDNDYLIVWCYNRNSVETLSENDMSLQQGQRAKRSPGSCFLKKKG